MEKLHVENIPTTTAASALGNNHSHPEHSLIINLIKAEDGSSSTHSLLQKHI